MFQLTCNLGLHEYKRDTCEVLLCEGTPWRYLEKVDIFLPDGTKYTVKSLQSSC